MPNPAADPDPDDPKGLIRESFRIEGITAEQCRSILVDWALSLRSGRDMRAALEALQARYGGALPDHPMSTLLTEAAHTDLPVPRRRGGRAGRFGSA